MQPRVPSWGPAPPLSLPYPACPLAAAGAKRRGAPLWRRLGGLGVALLALGTPAGQGAAGMEVLGWVETAMLEPGNLKLRAKLDSGARHSSLHVVDPEEFTRNGQPWVRFTVTNREGEFATYERPVVRTARIKRLGGGVTLRPVVRLGICVGTVFKEVEVNLEDRTRFLYKLLVGRSFLKGSVLIDAGRSLSAPPTCKGPGP